jgi:hypothetical protein
MYKVPSQFYFRLHHVRPRFKTDVEGVLVYMCESIAKLKPIDSSDFKENLNQLIKAYPGNGNRELKTINNWRTEISALFGLFQTHNGMSFPGLRAEELASSGDVPKFFKTFLFFFQYPGAHIKPNEVLEQIRHGIHFKPAQYILQIYKVAEQNQIHNFGLSKAEVCHCIFNDLRATACLETPTETFRRINDNKLTGLSYDETGDVIRYAGDILDYMENANLLRSYNGVFYLNKSEGLTISKFLTSTEWFNKYDSMISSKSGNIDKVKSYSEDWFSYVNSSLNKTDFSTDLSSFFNPTTNSDNLTPNDDSSHLKLCYDKLIKKLKINVNNISTKAIGDIGEGIVEDHEQKKLNTSGYDDLIHLVTKIPTPLSVGYDIQSFEIDGTRHKKYIEVKTTISEKPMKFDRVHLTSNEWNSAQTLLTTYYIYRLQITKSNIVLFVINNPVGLYKADIISMTPKNDGAELQFMPNKVGHFEQITL